MPTPSHASDPVWRTLRLERWVLGAWVVLALLLRLPVEGLPPGLYRDEAFYALDALATWVEGPRGWYGANNGREPLFVWLLTPFVTLLGPSPAAIRLPAAFAGAVAVAATGVLGRALWGRRAGLVAAALLAVAPWPVWLGRLGLRAALLPAILAMAGAAAAIGWRRRAAGRPGARGWLVLGGLLAGLGHATYTAALAAPLVMGGWLLWRVVSRPRLLRAGRAWLDGAAWLLPWGLLAGGVLWAAADAGAAPWSRAAQVAIVGGAEGQAAWAGRVLRGLADTAGLVFVRGDGIVRHNVPGRPFLAPVMAGVWLLGLVGLLAAVARRRGHRGPADVRRAAAVALLCWLVGMALPTALAEDAPHFLRAVGLLPALAVVAGVGAEWVWRVARGVGTGRLATGVAGVVVVGALVAELAGSVGYARALTRGRAADPWAHEGLWASEDAGAGAAWREAYHGFEGGAAEVARQAAAEVGYGWEGGWGAPWPGPAREAAARRLAAGEVAGVLREPGGPPPGERAPAWLDRRLRDGWTSVALLAPIEGLTLIDPYDPVLAGDRGVAWIVPAGIDPERMWAELPPTVTVRLAPVATERGDLVAEASTIAVRAEVAGSDGDGYFTGMRTEFEAGPSLVGAGVVEGPWPESPAGLPTGGGRARWLETWWRREGDAPLASGDPWLGLAATMGFASPTRWREAPLGLGVLPPSVWRPGQQVIVRRPLTSWEGPAADRPALAWTQWLRLRAGADGAVIPALDPTHPSRDAVGWMVDGPAGSAP